MTGHIPELTVLISLGALIIPGAILLGHRIGKLSASVDSAHHRLDRLEKLLTDGFTAMRVTLRESIEESWRRCPLAFKDHGGERGGSGGAT